MIPFSRLRDFVADVEKPSPNWSARPAAVDAIACAVIHGTADGGNEVACLEWLRAPRSQVSAHLLILRDGTVIRLVKDRRKAWHAGKSDWRLHGSNERVSDLNRISLGWELANRQDGAEEFTDQQYAALARIAAFYIRLGLELENITGHENVSPGRKVDPGPTFNWARFKVAVLTLLHPDPEPHVIPLHSPPPEIDQAA